MNSVVRFDLKIFCLLIIINSCNYRKHNETVSNKFSYDTIYYESQNRYEIYTMRGSEKYGVMKLYDKRFGEIEERLFIQDKLMIIKIFGGDSIDIGYTYFYNQNDTLYPIGSIIFNRKNHQKENIKCSYFDVDAPDTIEFNKPYKINIRGNIGLKNNFKLSLTIGEIDSAYNIMNKKATYISEGRELEFEILDYKMGINLITGILSYYENDKDITKEYRISKIDVPLIFYKQFVAVPPSK